MKTKINNYINQYSESSPLIVFRVLFGLIMLISVIRFWSNGWIETTYINPDFHFKYYGFEWVKSLGSWNYVLFLICGLSSFFIMIGYKYTLSCIIFFTSFTYIELIDKTTYLNHYYFISIISFILIFVPANCQFSVDSFVKKISYISIPRWSIDVVKYMLFIVYFCAGIAKINSDWLLEAQPLKTWLPGKYDLPLVGEYLHQSWTHYFMSWGGMIYDILIGFLLFSKKFRNYAFILVIIFHVMTSVFFPSIGMFPYIMIIATMIFLDSHLHNKIILFLSNFFKLKKESKTKEKIIIKNKKLKIITLSLLIFLQIMLPFRYSIYDGELFWTEEGYRFSWRVMLMEKSGIATFTIIDNNSKKRVVVSNDEFLTSFQEKQMSHQPDFILEYANFLKEHYKQKGFSDPSVYVDCFVTLNGRLSKRFIKNDIDLLKINESMRRKNWILPFNDEIQGF
tara:strand:+ start:14559 stop:15914 length:1356 start_codon:yes stop_codon:yes gene_type:complete